VAWVRFRRGIIYGLILLLVVSLLQGFSFLPSFKNNTSKFHFAQNGEPTWKQAKSLSILVKEGALRDIPENGCEGEYIYRTLCSNSCNELDFPKIHL